MKKYWLQLNRPQQILLLLQGIMFLLFLILYCTIGRQQVLWYENTQLRCRTENEVTTYSGKLDGQQAVITVSPGPVVEFRLGDTLYGSYSIVYDPSAVPDKADLDMYLSDMQELVGVEVWDGSRLLFRGAYLDWYDSFMLFDENGKQFSLIDAYTVVSDADGWIRDYDPAPSVHAILQIAITPDVVSRGHLEGFLIGALVCAVCAFSILFADALFRFHLSFRIRYPDEAEPSEWELFGRWVGWIVMTVTALVCFISGLTLP